MAKEKGEGEGYEFLPPDFNEDAFIHKEVVEYKTTVIRTVLALAAAFAALAAFHWVDGNDETGWPMGIAICIAFGLLMKPLFARFTDISVYKRGDWIQTALMFFLTWLAFFIILVNPPISDFAGPQLEASADPPFQMAGGEILLNVLAADNEDLNGPPRIELRRADGTLVAETVDPGPARNGTHYSIPLGALAAGPGHYVATVEASDGRRSSRVEAHFNVTADPARGLQVTLPDGNLTGEAEVRAAVPAPTCTAERLVACVRTVAFVPDEGVRVPFKYDTDRGRWWANARFAGWPDGTVSGRVVAEFVDHFQGNERVPGGTLASEPVTLTVHPPGGERTTVAEMPNPDAKPVFASGYGLLGVLGAILLVAAVRRGQEERR